VEERKKIKNKGGINMLFKTTNGVDVTFDNNIITNIDKATKPLLSFDSEGNLIEICFDGYEIKKI
jgi:hypothetical protein